MASLKKHPGMLKQYFPYRGEPLAFKKSKDLDKELSKELAAAQFKTEFIQLTSKHITPAKKCVYSQSIPSFSSWKYSFEFGNLLTRQIPIVRYQLSCTRTYFSILNKDLY